MNKIYLMNLSKSCFTVFLLAAFCVLSATSLGFAAEPIQILEDYSEKVIDILKDSEEEDQEITKEQLDQLKDLGMEIFSFEQISMRTLGRNWPKLNKEQQSEFVELFPRLLEKNYLSKINEYRQESVEFTKETIFSKRKAEVKSKIKTKSKEIPVDYRLVKVDKEWKIYDVIVEGISLVKNYRSQFSEILADNSPKKMLEILRKKINEKNEN